MKIIRFLNGRIKKFTIFDLKLSQGIGLFLALIVAGLYPEITNVSIWWFVAGLVLCTLRPIYIIFSGK